MLGVKLCDLDPWTDRRRANAARYHELFREMGLASVVGLPATGPDCKHVWNQ